MRRLRFLAVLLIVIGCAAWVYVSPRLAAKRFRDAVNSGDAKELNVVVDFPALRKNLQADLRAAGAQRASNSNLPNPLLAQLGAELGGVVSDAAIERIVSPSGIIRLARYGSSPSSSTAAQLLGMGYRGISDFGVTMGNARGQDLVTFLFHRSGTTWRLARLDIPSLTHSR